MCILAIFLGAILSGFAAAAVLKRYCAPKAEIAAGQMKIVKDARQPVEG
jgi:hypothetical protein